MANIKFKFPKRFYWGVSTSAHQIEGNTHNQWTVWELENAKSLAKAASYRLEHLPAWKEVEAQATAPENYISGDATDHYNLYEQDFDAVKAMGMNSFRFSIEWSRIEPKEGQFDATQIQHYRDYIKALRARGIEPFVTLYHWTVPVWFNELGGFEKQANIKYFTRYADKILQELGPDIKYVTTINEPDTVTIHGYFTGEHPPQKRAALTGIWVYINLLRAHKRVYKLAAKRSRRFKVGFSKSYAYVTEANDDWLSRLAVRLDYLVRDDLVLWFVGRKIGFIGVNYYFSDKRDKLKLVDPDPETPVNDLGWEMLPDNLEFVLKRLGRKRSKTPLIVTESGVADHADRYRQWWIAHTIQAMHNALHDGVRLEGYLHWSLLDNFEWAYGRWPRFGLLEVDYKTMKRTPRASALWYSKAVKNMRK